MLRVFIYRWEEGGKVGWNGVRTTLNEGATLDGVGWVIIFDGYQYV